VVDRKVMTVRNLEPWISLEPLKLLVVMTASVRLCQAAPLHGDAYCYAGCDGDCDADGYCGCDADDYCDYDADDYYN
jgi:hypothetical protein